MTLLGGGTSQKDDIAFLEGVLILSIILGPLNLIILILLSVIRRTRQIAWGIFAAIGLNLLISLLMGSFENAFCMVPFMVGN
jgi:hypothetical protein